MITKPTRTESTYTDNSEVRRLAGYSDVKRVNQKDISVALYDVDFAIKWHMENVIQPTITEGNSIITVPILFSSGEKWAAVQKHGYLRDNQGKILSPLIMIKRNSVSKREDIQDIKVLETPDARITFETKYTKQNRYDRFSVLNGTPPREFYSVDVPKFVQVEYDVMCWTNNTSQLNEIVEQLIWFDGKAFGDTHKFNTYIDPPTFDTTNNTGEDRIVRATLPMRTKAHILNTHGPNAPAMYKLQPVNKLVIGMETDVAISSVSNVSNAASIILSTGGSSTSGGGNISILSSLQYLNTNHQLTGTVINSNTITFASGWISATTQLPATSVNNFTFFINGQMLERSSITSFTQDISGDLTTLVINTTSLGFTLNITDEVIGIGKFINQDTLA
jgi:hypothetical protein